ncbi:MAG: hypothetical protein VW976_03700, partial [Flavobacteriaceae bacterium]
ECTEDRAIPIEVQRAMYKGKVKKHFSLMASHTPNFSKPDSLAYFTQEDYPKIKNRLPQEPIYNKNK